MMSPPLILFRMASPSVSVPPAQQAPRRRRSRTLQQQRARMFYILILPWFIGFIVFYVGPMIFSFALSLTKWRLLDTPSFVGLQNYSDMMHDSRFWQSIKVTTIYVVGGVPLALVTALLLALLLNQNVRGQSVFRTIFYLPSVVTGVAVSVLFVWIFNPEFGLLNNVLSLVGINGPGWIASVDWALPALIITSLWGIGGTMLIFLAGLQGIPQELQEAASLDGAGALARFFHLTLPLLTPTILFNLILLIIFRFQDFTNAYVMTSGGPLDSTLFYVYYIWLNAFQYIQMGYATALAWVLFMIILVLTVVIFTSSDRWVFYFGGD
jgi:multiple sugar transport system permease protein